VKKRNSYLNQVQNRVLKVYKEVSPSFRKLVSKKDFKENLEQRVNILRALGLPEQVFNGKMVLEVGGGTGENSIFYSMWGADVTIADPNNISLQRAAKLYKNNNLKVKLINKNLFDLKMSFIKKFDIVICEGVVQHTATPSAALELLLKSVKAGCIFMIALSEKNGFYKRTLQRKFIKSISKNNDEIITNSYKFFKNHLKRASKYGLRSEISIIYDTYINPQVKAISLKNICNMFFKNNFYYLSSYPSINDNFQVSPWSQKKIDPFNYNAHKNRYKMIEKLWRVSGNFNKEKIFFSGKYSLINAYLDKVDKKLTKLNDNINKKNLKNIDLSLIQDGYLGIGMNYFVAVKK
tara:strand:- start:1146 stop:2195 length:1050 start_codon:yes stop_codon:yes gene_type:complete